MIIKSLSIRNFRNIKSADFEFSPDVNIFTGNNAQGKTNLCEAVSICLGKNFRDSKNDELVPFNSDSGCETTIELIFSFDKIERDNKLFFRLKGNSARLTFNDMEMKSAEELYGALRYVSFIPDDLFIVKGSPEKRRNYIDYVSNMINRVHNSKVYEYNKALKQKNNLLVKLNDNSYDYAADMVESWNDTLAKLGINVLYGRMKYFSVLEEYTKEFYSLLNKNNEILSVKYESNIIENVAYPLGDTNELYKIYMNKLKNKLNEELRLKHTVIGVHRDDIAFSINDMPSKLYASQGQTRSIAIALKLAEARMIYEKSNDYPIMILDDVLSELDSFRRGFIINHIDKLQTFITSCNISDIKELSDGKVWRVNNGEFEVY